MLCQKKRRQVKTDLRRHRTSLFIFLFPPLFSFYVTTKSPDFHRANFQNFCAFLFFYLLFLRQSPRKYIFTLPRSPALHPRPASEVCAFPLSLRSFCKSALLWLPGSSLCPSGPSIRCSTPGTLSRTSPSGTGP